MGATNSFLNDFDKIIEEAKQTDASNMLYLQKCKEYLKLLSEEYNDCYKQKKDATPIILRMGIVGGLIVTLTTQKEGQTPQARQEACCQLLNGDPMEAVRASGNAPLFKSLYGSESDREVVPPKDPSTAPKPETTPVAKKVTAGDVLAAPLSSGLSGLALVKLILKSIVTLGQAARNYRMFRDKQTQTVKDLAGELNSNQLKPRG